MSELTRCNYCTLEQLKAAVPAWTVELRENEYGWLDVYVDGKRHGTSFLAITDHCVC